MLAPLIAAVLALSLLLVPVIYSAATTRSNIPLFDSRQYTAEQLTVSTLHDGIPDVWKIYYGLSTDDVNVANADYNGTGVMNTEKYQLNIYPLAPADPLPHVTPPKARAKAAAPTAKKDAPNTPGPLFENMDFRDGAGSETHPTSGGYKAKFRWNYNDWGDGTEFGWKAVKGKMVEVWKDPSGKQFVELNSNVNSSGIEQKIATPRAGTYLLSWRHLGRHEKKAGENTYSVHVFAKDIEDDDGALKYSTAIPTSPSLHTYHAPTTTNDYGKPKDYPAVGDWQQETLVFTITEEVLAAHPDIWNAFVAEQAGTYGAFIADVSLTMVELEVAVPKEDSDVASPVLAANGNAGPVPGSSSPEMDIAYNAYKVPADKKNKVGAWAVLNFDDDDARGNYSHGNTSATSDMEFSGAVTQENDLLRLGIKKIELGANITPSNNTNTISYRLKFDSTNIRLWKKPNRTEQVTSEQTEFTVAVGENYAVLYVEGIKAHDDDEGTIITEQFKVGSGAWQAGDTVKIRVAHPIVVLFTEDQKWTRSDGEPIAEFAKGRAIKGVDGEVNPLYLRAIVNRQGDTIMIPGVNEAKQKVCYSVTGLTGQNAYKIAKLALKTEGAHIAFNGHANWGVGMAFGLGFENFNQFFWCAGEGKPAVNVYGFHEHKLLSPWLDIIPGFPTPNFDATAKWNAMHVVNAQNRFLNGVPLANIVRYPNIEIPVVAPGQTFAPEHKQHMTSVSSTGIINETDLIYHFVEDPAVDANVGQDMRTILQQPGNSDVPANLKYKSLMLTECNSYRSFIESFKHGRVIGTWNFVKNRVVTQTYVIQTVDGKTAAEMKTALDTLEQGNPTGGQPGMFQVSDF